MKFYSYMIAMPKSGKNILLPTILMTFVLLGFTGATTYAQVEVTSLDGQSVVGELVSLDAEQLVLNVGDAVKVVALDRVMNIAWPEHELVKSVEEANLQTLLLTDGSSLSGQNARTDGLNVTFDSQSLGSMTVPLKNVKSLRFKPLNATSTEQWNALIQKPNSDDRLVIQKGEVLDFLAGVVTQYNTENVQFLYQGSEIPVRLAKVFGIIHPVEMMPNQAATCSLKTTSGESLFVTQVSVSEGQMTVRTGPGEQVVLPLESITQLDFSLGRIVYLSDMTPEGTEYTPFFDTVWEYQRDRTVDGSPLQIGRKKFSKGLWVHSKTTLTYRLAGEFSRLQATLGIDDAVALTGHGNVDVVVTADDEVLFEQNISARDSAIPLDLPLTGKRFLKITVDFGKGLDIGDHLDIADARLIK
ncbi:NPCBM/NEW2 domain-containing protein [Rubinisphaera sp.]|mgnify:CR=1 FL=1|uniref:NPCBM/NEW2 domain-containing protein n=1 Tax=Rubinisphaera sp. TaxID=2024857 RepID=UPI0025DB8134|nr:NPCBM/NEW2 domain-containing protein [Rubinisphaera sp.]